MKKKTFTKNNLIFAQGQWCFNIKLYGTLSIKYEYECVFLLKKNKICVQRNKPKNITSTHVRLLPEFKHINEGRKRN